MGIATRIATFLCSGEMAVAYFTAHFPHNVWPALNQGDYLVFAGPGAWSVGGLLSRSVPAD